MLLVRIPVPREGSSFHNLVQGAVFSTITLNRVKKGAQSELQALSLRMTTGYSLYPHSILSLF